MLHISKLNLLLEEPNNIFSFKAVKMSTGEIIEGTNCICTSSNFQRYTKNIKWLDSGEKRKIRTIAFIEYNGVEVFI